MNKTEAEKERAGGMILRKQGETGTNFHRTEQDGAILERPTSNSEPLMAERKKKKKKK